MSCGVWKRRHRKTLVPTQRRLEETFKYKHLPGNRALNEARTSATLAPRTFKCADIKTIDYCALTVVEWPCRVMRTVSVMRITINQVEVRRVLQRIGYIPTYNIASTQCRQYRHKRNAHRLTLYIGHPLRVHNSTVLHRNVAIKIQFGLLMKRIGYGYAGDRRVQGS